jgi:hypothetical protein
MDSQQVEVGIESDDKSNWVRARAAQREREREISARTLNAE